MASVVNLKPVDQKDPKEAQKIVDLVKENYPDLAYFPDLDEVMNGKVHYFWAVVDNEIVGTSGYYTKTPTLAETVKTIILKEHRGKGHGKIISQAIEDHMKSIGIKKVMTTIYASNIAMITIKMKQGYIVEGYHPDHERPGWPEYSLGKILN